MCTTGARVTTTYMRVSCTIKRERSTIDEVMTMILKGMYRENGKWVVQFEHDNLEQETIDQTLGGALRLMWRMI